MNLTKTNKNYEDCSTILSTYTDIQFEYNKEFQDLFNSINITIMSEYETSRVL